MDCPQCDVYSVIYQLYFHKAGGNKRSMLFNFQILKWIRGFPSYVIVIDFSFNSGTVREHTLYAFNIVKFIDCFIAQCMVYPDRHTI